MSEHKPLTGEGSKRFRLEQEDDHTVEFNARRLEIQKLRTDNAKLRAALEKYAQHLANCKFDIWREAQRSRTKHGLTASISPKACTCGLNEASAAKSEDQ